MRKIRFFVLAITLALNQSTVLALDVATTPKVEFIPAAPLVISAYQTAGTATSLAAVEVYNDSATPVDLQQWQLRATTKDGTTYAVTTETHYSGLLLPKQHITYSASSSSTYSLTPAKQAAVITTIELNYIGADAVYKPAVAPVKDATDVPFYRNYTTTGYSTAAQPFATAPTRHFYDDGLYQAPVDPTGLKIIELYPYASDCAPNDTSVLCGDYIKIANTSDRDMVVDDLVVRTDSNSSNRTSSNTFSLAGTVKAHDFLLVAKTDDGAKVALTNGGGYVWIEDAWGLARYDATMMKYESAGSSQQGFAYALNNLGEWVWTTTPQPTGANVIAAPVVAVADCPEGKYRNPETGRCRTIEEAVNALAECDEGYERNPTTNRCRKVATATTASLTPCGEGQERNPATNRCRSIATAVAELLPCDEGYERNPATNRCRKVHSDTVPSAAFPVTPTGQSQKDMAGWWAFGIVLAIALGYGVWEWRRELAGLGGRAFARFGRSK